MSEAIKEEPQYAQAPDWSEWGPVYDRKATVGVISALQAKGLRVRCVKEATFNRLYVQRPA